VEVDVGLRDESVDSDGTRSKTPTQETIDSDSIHETISPNVSTPQDNEVADTGNEQEQDNFSIDSKLSDLLSRRIDHLNELISFVGRCLVNRLVRQVETTAVLQGPLVSLTRQPHRNLMDQIVAYEEVIA
jgi:hypothetical protein